MRYDIINKLIQVYNHQSYLEIGYLNGETFNKIKCPTKNSVDPNGKAQFKMISDDFFNNIAFPNGNGWDIIFIDGDHDKGQVKKDIVNSLRGSAMFDKIKWNDCRPRIGFKNTYLEEDA